MQINLDALLAKLPAFQRESDGSIITECPICSLENGKGHNKVKVFPNGRFACARFIGLSDEVSREHRQAILSAWGISEVTPAFITESLFDGKLTLDIRRAARGKYRVTARNCESTFAVEEMNIADARARERFIKSLDLSEFECKTVQRSLINLADRALKVSDAVATEDASEVAEASFVVLSDGRLAEQIAQGFALYDPQAHATSFVDRVTDSDKTYIPLQDEFIKETGGMYMPSTVEEYGSEKELDRAIEDYLSRYIDFSPLYLKLTAKYIRLTYLADKLKEISYLRAVGDRGNGKSRFVLATGLPCYRSVLVISPSAASLFRIVDRYKPTLILDEANYAQNSDDYSALLQILNAGYQRAAKVSRCEPRANGGFETKLYDPFGAKIIASLKTTESQAFESRCVRVVMERTHRKDIRLRMSAKMFSEAETLRNKLTLWRLRNWHRDFEAELDRAEEELKEHRIDPRYIQIAIPLYALLQDQTLKDEFIEMLKARDESDAEERQQSLDGQIVGVIHDLLFESHDDDTVTLRMKEGIAAPADGEPCELLPVETITERLNEDLPEKKKHQSNWISKQIRKLELRTQKIKRRGSDSYQKSVVVFDSGRLGKLFEIYSLPVSADFIRRTGRSADNTVICNDLTCVRQDSENEPDAIHRTQAKYQMNNNIERVSPMRPMNLPEDEEQTLTDAEKTITPQEYIALDTETESFDKKRGITPRNARMIGLALCYDGERADYVTDASAWPFLLPDSEQTVIFHHAKFDFGVLQRTGLPIPEKWEDTLIAAHLIDENTEHGLKPLAKRLLGVEPVTFEEADSLKLIDPEVFQEYARNDARYTFRLWKLFKAELEAQDLIRVYELEKKLVPVVTALEEAGMQIDLATLKDLNEYVKSELTRIESQVYEKAGCQFDLHSPEKVATILYDKLGLKCPKETKKGSRSVDHEALSEISSQHEAAAALLEYRELDKLASTFIKVLPKYADEHGRVHAEFNQLGTKSGRFSCRHPNLQQVPARSELGERLRSCFIAAEGKKLMVADYSQMELRVLAHYSRDPLLLEAYNSEEEIDLHTMTASRMLNKAVEEVSKQERTIAKMINFGIAYGISATGLFNRLKALGVMVSEYECEGLIKSYFRMYAKVADFLREVDQVIKQRGYVRSLYGRRRRVTGQTRREIRQAQNFIIQATAADLCKQALVDIHAALPEGAEIVAQVHDEVIVECRMEQAEEVKAITIEMMSRAPESFAVPLRVDAHIVDRWGDAK